MSTQKRWICLPILGGVKRKMDPGGGSKAWNVLPGPDNEGFDNLWNNFTAIQEISAEIRLCVHQMLHSNFLDEYVLSRVPPFVESNLLRRHQSTRRRGRRLRNQSEILDRQTRKLRRNRQDLCVCQNFGDWSDESRMRWRARIYLRRKIRSTMDKLVGGQVTSIRARKDEELIFYKFWKYLEELIQRLQHVSPSHVGGMDVAFWTVVVVRESLFQV